MALHANSILLVQHLQQLPLFDGRFSKIQLVNLRGGGKRGAFSLVFKAYDEVEQKPVALKFYDLDPQLQNDQYRRAAFVRENEILQSLLGVRRALQLVKALTQYHFHVPVSSGAVVLLCEYFAVDWLDTEIDEFFLRSTETPESKLRLFNEIVLAVETLHHHEVFHRDLKADNLRASEDALKRIVVAIDLGTAAKMDSGPIAGGYGAQVGHILYASPEALSGLAGNREIARFADFYALGCLLFELFNRDHCFYAINAANADLGTRLLAMSQLVATRGDDVKQRAEWDGALDLHSKGVTPVEIDGPGSMVPLALVGLLNEVVEALTHVDYRKRKSLEWVRQRIWSAIRLLANEKAYQRQLKLKRDIRTRKKLRAQVLDQKFQARRKLLGAP